MRHVDLLQLASNATVVGTVAWAWLDTMLCAGAGGDGLSEGSVHGCMASGRRSRGGGD